MTLREWLDWHKKPTHEFAALIGVTYVSVTRYLAGTRIPKWHIIQAISDATGGHVTANDWGRK